MAMVRQGIPGTTNTIEVDASKVVAGLKACDPAPAVSATAEVKATYKQRDFDAEARGKTRCALYAAALGSTLLQQWAGTKEEYKALLKEFAEEGVRYSFEGR